MRKQSVQAMLNRYKMVYIKPDIGSYGTGVIRIEKVQGNKRPYRYQKGLKARSFSTYSAMYQSLVQNIPRRKYLVQQGIELLRHRGHRFDLRVMAQKNPRNQWETTGMIGKVASPGKVVTNIRAGGSLKSVNTLLQSHMSASRLRTIKNTLRKLGVRSGVMMNRKFPRVNTIGLDVGVDHRHRPWIFEVNTNPALYVFKTLKDPRIYQKIHRYAKKLGRI